MIAKGTNALASSIVLVCRPRPTCAPTATRREFQRRLREEMPEALEAMIGSAKDQTPIAPLDLAQAAIGSGMAIFSQYRCAMRWPGSTAQLVNT